MKVLNAEAQDWAKQRNDSVVKIDWRVNNGDARGKLKHLYPKTQF